LLYCRVFILSIFSCLILLSEVEAVSKGIEPKVAPEKKKLIWLVEDKTENMGLMDPSIPNRSAATATERHVIFQLDDYDVTVERVAIKRINHLLKVKPNACVANRAKLPEREEYSIFSNPQSFYLTHKLFRYNKSSPFPRALFNEKSELVSLLKLFEWQKEERIGLVEGVSYGSFLDEQVKKLSPNNVYYRGGTHRVTAIESMLYAGRVDYLLALPVDMNPTAEQNAQLEQYNIAGAPKFVIAHFSCSKSEFGQQAINSINEILMETYKEEPFFSINRPWYSETDLQFIQSYLQTHHVNPKVMNSKTAF
jgi:uncharacterized protein (TIGR02285 family)